VGVIASDNGIQRGCLTKEGEFTERDLVHCGGGGYLEYGVTCYSKMQLEKMEFVEEIKGPSWGMNCGGGE